MTRAEYIRRTQYNHRKKKMVVYATRISVAMGAVVLAVLAFFGCIYVHDTFWGEESVISNSMLAANGDQTGSEIKEIQAVLGNEESYMGAQMLAQNGQTDGAGVRGEVGAVENAESNEQKMPTVVIDAGHGGNDGGTYSGKIIEKDITLAVAKKIQKMLEEQEINVIMTRDTDKYLALKERTNLF